MWDEGLVIFAIRLKMSLFEAFIWLDTPLVCPEHFKSTTTRKNMKSMMTSCFIKAVLILGCLGFVPATLSQSLVLTVNPPGTTEFTPGQQFCYTAAATLQDTDTGAFAVNASITLNIPDFLVPYLVLTLPANAQVPGGPNNPVVGTSSGGFTPHTVFFEDTDGVDIGLAAGTVRNIGYCFNTPADCEIIVPGVCGVFDGDLDADNYSQVSVPAGTISCPDYPSADEINIGITNQTKFSECANDFNMCFDVYPAKSITLSNGGGFQALPATQGGIAYTNGTVVVNVPATYTITGSTPPGATVSGQTVTWSNQTFDPNTASINPSSSPNYYCVIVSLPNPMVGDIYNWSVTASGENCLDNDTTTVTLEEDVEECVCPSFGCYLDDTPACPGEMRDAGLIINSATAITPLCITQRVSNASLGFADIFYVSNAVSSVPFTAEYLIGNLNTGTWSNWPGITQPISANGVVEFDLTTIGADSNNLVNIRYKFDSIPVSAMPFCIGARIQTLPTYYSASLDDDTLVSGLISIYNYERDDCVRRGTGSCSVRMKLCIPQPCMDKTINGLDGEPNSAPVFTIGDLATVCITLNNTSGEADIQDLEIYDLLPSDMRLVVNSSFPVNITGNICNQPTIVPVQNWNGTGRDFIKFVWPLSAPACISQSDTLQICYTVEIVDTAVTLGQNCTMLSIPSSVSGTSGNIYPATTCASRSDRCVPFGSYDDYYCGGRGLSGPIGGPDCGDIRYANTIGATGYDDARDFWDFDGDGNTGERLYTDCACYGVEAGLAALDSVKRVKGDLDTEFSDCGITAAGGKYEYQICFENVGQPDLRGFMIMDVLPHVGDTAVTGNGTRNSQWDPCICGPITIPSLGASLYTIEYSTEVNPCEPVMGITNSANNACVTPTWLPYGAFSNLCDIASFRVDFSDTWVLDSGEEICFSWPMLAPATAMPNTTNFNSYAIEATDGALTTQLGADDNVPTTEPPKVKMIIAECGFSNAVATTVCNDQGTSDPTDDTYTIDFSINGFNLGMTYDLVVTQRFGAAGQVSIANNLSYGSTNTLGPFNTSIGDVVITVLDQSPPIPRKRFDVIVLAPSPCSFCEIIDLGVVEVCNSGGTLLDPSDDTFEVYINPVVDGLVDSTFSLSGSLTANNVSYTNAGPIFSFTGADAGTYTLNYIDDLNPSCPGVIQFEVPTNCLGSCGLELVSATPGPCDASGRFELEYVVNYCTPESNRRIYFGFGTATSLPPNVPVQTGCGTITNTLTYTVGNGPTNILLRLGIAQGTTFPPPIRESCRLDAPLNYTEPLCPFDLALTKTLAPTQTNVISAGDTVAFEITITNQGETVANHWEITDYYPPGFTFVSASPDGLVGDYTDNGTSGVWTNSRTLGGSINLFPGQSYTITVNLQAPSSPSGSFTNFAEISYSEDAFGNTNDLDSTADGDNTNDGTPVNDETGNAGGDEDDHDPEVITVLPLVCESTVVLSDVTPCECVELVDGQEIPVPTLKLKLIALEEEVPDIRFQVPVKTRSIPECPFYCSYGVTVTVSYVDVDTSLVTNGIFEIAGLVTQSVRITNSSGSFSGLINNLPAGGDPLVVTFTPIGVDNCAGITNLIPAESCNPCDYDLALCKKLAPGESGAVTLGGDVTFEITVTNQSLETASSVVITDYIPTGFVLNDTAWTDLGSTATFDVPGSLVAGAAYTAPITLTYTGGVTDAIATNFAEISSAENDDGGPFDDWDSDPDNMNDETNVVDDVVDNTGGDEDDHDPATVNILVFDLALTKTLASTGPFAPGGTVIYNINITNQGDVAAQNISLVDYIPAGLTLVTTGGWSEPVAGTASNVYVGPLMPMMSDTVQISFTIDSGASGMITNFAEIAGSEDMDGNPQQDEDSTPDSDPNNDGDPSDDVTDNTNDDEDDHDPEVIEVGVFDLALTKTLSSAGPFAPGDPITFTILVTNQGTIAATSISVVDYFPAGLSLIPLNGWTEPTTGVASNILAGPIAAGGSDTLQIFFTIDEGVSGSFTNFSEIAYAEDPDGNPQDDVDSDPDSDPNNDGEPTDGVTDNTNDDEDDHDPEVFTVTPLVCDATVELSDATPCECVELVDGQEIPAPTLQLRLIAIEAEVEQVRDIRFEVPVKTRSIPECPFYCSYGVTVTVSYVDVDTSLVTNGIFEIAGLVTQSVRITNSSGSFSGLINNLPAGGDPLVVTFTPIGVDNCAGITNLIPAESCNPCDYDLALCKKLAPGESGAVTLGGDVTFEITVTNQSLETASSVVITDYIPTGFVLNDTAWTDLGSTATFDVPGSLVAGAAYTAPITLTYTGGVTDAIATNFAEISSAENDDGGPFDDWDSDPDNMNDETNVVDDVVDNTGGDEDDHDPATVNILVFDLALTKTLASTGPFAPGGTVIYNINITNQGDVAAQNISLVDYIPAGLTLVTTGGWSEPVAGTASNVYVGPLMPMMSDTVQISFTIDSGASGMITNFAEIAGSEDMDGNPQQDEDSTPDSDPNNDGDPSDDVTDNTNDDEDDHDPEVIEVGVFDLALTKTLSSAGPFAPGDPITFTILVTNQGTIAATSISVVDYFPAGLSLIPLNGWTEPTTGVASNILAGPIAAGGSDTLQIFFTIDEGVSGSFTNFSEIAYAEDPDGNPQDDVDSDPDSDPNNDGEPTDGVTDNTNDDEDDHDPEVFTVETFDLALTKMIVTAGPFSPGDTIEYAILITNQGDIAAQNISVVDYIPAGLTLVSGFNGWTEPTTGIASNIVAGPIAAGSSETLAIRFTIDTDATGSLTNFAEIAYAEDPDGNPGDDIDSDPDTDPENDGDPTDDVTDNTNDDEDDHDPEVIDILPPGAFDLALTKVLTSTGPFNPGDTLEYVIMITNQGDVAAQNISVVDYIPAGLTLVSAFNGWTEPVTGIASNIVAGPIAAGAADMLTVRFSIDAGVSGSLTNFAEIAYAEDPDGNPGDDIDSDPDTDPNNDGDPTDDATDNTNNDEDDHDPETVWVGPRFTVTKTLVSPTADAQVGDTLVFRLTVINLTPDVLNPIQLVDSYDPAYLAYLSATFPESSTGTGTVTWDNVGPIDGNSGIFVDASFLALQTTEDLTTNTVVGTYPPEPPVTNEVPVEINPAWTIVKEVIRPSSGFAQIGDDVVYRITLSNISTNSLSDFTVTDSFDPTYLQFEMASVAQSSMTMNTIVWSGISLPGGGEFVVDIRFTAISDTTEPTINYAIGSRPPEPPVTNEVPVEIGTLFRVVKTLLSPDNPQVGDTLVFELSVENLTTNVLDPFTLVDSYDPAYLEYLTAAVTPDVLDVGSVTWTNVGPIAGLETFSVTVDFLALQITDPETINTVVGSTTGEPPVTNSIPVEIDPAWTIVKTLKDPSSGVASIGDDVTFNLTVSNISTNPVSGITLTDLYDASILQFVGATITPDVDTPPMLTWAVPTLPVGGEFSVDVTFTAIAGTDPTTINYAIGDRPGEPPVTNEVPLVVDPVFDLALEKIISPNQEIPVFAGDSLVYWIVITNEGNITAYDIDVTDTIPVGLTFVSAGSTGWTLSGSTAAYTLAGPLAAGESVNIPITFTIDADATSPLFNVAEITSATDEPGGDPVPDVDSTPDEDPENDPPEEDDHDTEEVPFAVFDLALIKTVSSPTSGMVQPGDTVTFTIVVLNQGTIAATNVVITEHIPAGLTLVSAGWTTSGTTATFTLPTDVPPNMAVEVDVQFTINSDATGVIENVAEITGAEDPEGNTPDDIDSTGDPDPSNDPVIDNEVNDPNDEDDHDIEEITVNPAPVMDLALTKVITSSGPYRAGDTVTFTFNIFNQGSIDAYNIGLVDYIPAELTLDDARWALASDGLSATLNVAGPVAANGGTTTETISFTIDAGVSGPIVNGSEITGAQDENGTPVPDSDGDFDSDPDNDPPSTNDDVDNTNGDEDNEDSETFDVLPNFDLALLKDLADGQSSVVAPGDDITFNVTIYNQGDVDAYDIQVIDYIPAGLVLNDTDWVAVGDNAVYTFDGPLAPGANVAIPITLTILSAEGDLVNTAEILVGSDSPGGAPVTDSDSEPDSEVGNDPTIDGEINNPNDEDDSDPVTFTVITVSLGDYVWQDNDLDGIQDADEPGVPGVRVVLLDENGDYVTETVTLADGSYSFDGLAPGTYSVQFDTSTLNGSWSATLVNAGGDDTLDSDAGPDGLSPQTTLSNDGDRDPTLDFGIYPLGTVSGTIWEDMNNDGLKEDLSIYGLEDITVTLYIVNPDGSLTAFMTTQTGANGFYEFTDLPPGEYYIDYSGDDIPVRTPVLEASDKTPLNYTITMPVGGNIPLNDFAVLADPTAIDLASFTAVSVDGGIQVDWVTSSETDNLGFNVYRSASLTGERTRINSELILAESALNGATYGLLDTDAGEGTWFYFLEDIELTLASTMHGPAIAVSGDSEALAAFDVDQAGIYLVMIEESDNVEVSSDGTAVASHPSHGGLVFYAAAESLVELNYSSSPLRMGVRSSELDADVNVSLVVASEGQAEFETTDSENVLVDGFTKEPVVLDITDLDTPVVIDAAFIEHAEGSGVYFFSAENKLIKISEL